MNGPEWTAASPPLQPGWRQTDGTECKTERTFALDVSALTFKENCTDSALRRRALDRQTVKIRVITMPDFSFN